ncbi:MAG: 5-bromo-4-chloroindolyl phosphate hydrolysis family protein [Pseudomonadota bacterium]
MHLPEGARQIVAGMVSALAFLGLFFGLTLVWWAAFGLSALIFLAVLLIVRRKPGDDEIVVSGRTTEADIREAGRLMERASERLAAAEMRMPEADRSTVSAMVDHIGSIRAQILSDPEDYRRARRFITFYLGHMVETVERYTDLSEKSRGRHQERLAPLSAQIEAFLPALERIDAACLENDFTALESQMEALAVQMKRG